jgi:hypothetical protein
VDPFCGALVAALPVALPTGALPGAFLIGTLNDSGASSNASFNK